MRAQSEEAARATAEQARTMKEMAGAAASTARDVKSITQANRTQSASAAQLLSQVADIRRVTERNAEGVKQTRGGTAALLKQAEALTGIMGNAFPRTSKNGHGRGR
jgi:methyl-accepting chemotaxis protein